MLFKICVVYLYQYACNPLSVSLSLFFSVSLFLSCVNVGRRGVRGSPGWVWDRLGSSGQKRGATAGDVLQTAGTGNGCCRLQNPRFGGRGSSFAVRSGSWLNGPVALQSSFLPCPCRRAVRRGPTSLSQACQASASPAQSQQHSCLDFNPCRSFWELR